MIHNLKIHGMHCASCEKILKMSINEIDGANLLNLSSKDGSASVELNDASLLPKIKSAIKEAGYSVEV